MNFYASDQRWMKWIWEMMMSSGVWQRLPFLVLCLRSALWWLQGSPWWEITYQVLIMLSQVWRVTVCEIPWNPKSQKIVANNFVENSLSVKSTPGFWWIMQMTLHPSWQQGHQWWSMRQKEIHELLLQKFGTKFFKVKIMSIACKFWVSKAKKKYYHILFVFLHLHHCHRPDVICLHGKLSLLQIGLDEGGKKALFTFLRK